MTNRQIVLTVRPVGVPGPEHFELRTAPAQEPADGEFLVENHFLSVDPAQRGYVNDESNYAPPVPLGDVMRALAVGRVTASRCDGINTGEYLYGWFGWQDYCIATPELVLRRVDPEQAPLSAAAGVLGINGLTACMALHDIGAPKPGETVLVTAAAGAVGSLVGQLARVAGCRAVAVVGDDAKGEQCVAEFGYDAWINRRGDVAQDLARSCPDGVDIFFDNAGGEVADAVLRAMKLFGRVVQCGTLSITSWNPAPQGPRQEREILTRRLRVQGFVIFDHIARYDAVAEELASMLRAEQLHYAEDIETDIARAPQALADVYAGRNRGKKLIRLR